jgi:hypothetical protein
MRTGQAATSRQWQCHALRRQPRPARTAQSRCSPPCLLALAREWAVGRPTAGSARPALSINLLGGLDREPVSHLQRPPLEQDGDGTEDRLIAVCYSDSYRRLAAPLEDDGERIGLLRHACYPTKPASDPNEITAVAARLRAVHSCIQNSALNLS